jgi:hypothetical protein
VFKRVRRESPAAYSKVCALLVPREVKDEHSGCVKAMTDEQLEQAIEAIQGMLEARAATSAKVVEAVPEPAALPAYRKPRRKAKRIADLEPGPSKDAQGHVDTAGGPAASEQARVWCNFKRTGEAR